MNTKTNLSKKAIIASLIAVAAILAVGTIIAVSSSKKPIIAFYNVPDKNAAALQAALGDTFSYLLLSADRPLAWELEQQKNLDAVITPSGKALKDAQSAASKKIRLSPELLKDTTTSIKAVALTEKTREIQSLPLLSSHLELAIQTQELKKSGVKALNSWNDFERFAQAAKEKNNTHILFAGKESNTFLDILGALTESINSKQSYENAVQLIEIAVDKAQSSKKNEFDASKLVQLLAGTPDAPLYEAVRTINRWYKEGYLFSEVFSLDKTSVSALMENKIACAVIMSLEDHRAADRTIIEKYTSYKFPSNIPEYIRTFTAPVYFITPLKNEKTMIAAAEQLLTTETQEQLSRATGLAPVLARCRTPDRQADDARYWVAASNSPLAGLSREISLAHSQRELLASELAALVRFGSF